MPAQSRDVQTDKMVVVEDHDLFIGFEPVRSPEDSLGAQAATFTDVHQLTERIKLLEEQNDNLQKKVRYLQELCLMD